MTLTLSEKSVLTNYADKRDLKNGKIHVDDINKDFILIASYSNSINGYQGYAYQDKKDNKIYVVHAGSNDISDLKKIFTEESLKDWGITDVQLVMNNIPSQFYSAKYFLDSVRHTYNNDTNANMEQLGQSLGGTLANMLGMLRENENMKIECFNTLGAAKMEKVLKKLGYELSEDYSNINNYFYANEKISTLKTQIGNVYVSDYIETEHPAFHNLATHQKHDLDYKKVDLDSFNDKTIFNRIKTYADLVEVKKHPEKFLIKKAVDFVKTVKENSKYKIGIEENEYVVQKGDTLSGIAQKCGITEEELLTLNPWLAERYTEVGSSVLIHPDERLYLPQGVKPDFKIPEINKIYSPKQKNETMPKRPESEDLVTPTGFAAPLSDSGNAEEASKAENNPADQPAIEKEVSGYKSIFSPDYEAPVSERWQLELVRKAEKHAEEYLRKSAEKRAQAAAQAEEARRQAQLRYRRQAEDRRRKLAEDFEEYFRTRLDDFIIRMGFDMHDYN